MERDFIEEAAIDLKSEFGEYAIDTANVLIDNEMLLTSRSLNFDHVKRSCFWKEVKEYLTKNK